MTFFPTYRSDLPVNASREQLRFDDAANPLTGYALTASGTVTSFVVGRTSSGSQLELFATGTDGYTYGATLDASGTPTSGYFPALSLANQDHGTQLASTTDGTGHMVVLKLSYDTGNVYSLLFQNGGATADGGYESITSSGAVRSVTGAKMGDGNPELFAIGLDDMLYGLKFNALMQADGGYFLTQSGTVL